MSKATSSVSPVMNELSGYIAAANRRSLPPEVVESAKHHILDTFAAMVSGSRLAPGKLAAAYVKSLGRSRKEACVVGTNLVVCAVDAALANGMCAHGDETDDSHARSHTHPGCALVPAALAMAEREHMSGKALLRSIVLGYDICARLTLALGASQSYSAGLSTHGFGGTFGAAVAAGALAGLNARETRYVLSYAAQQASGTACLVRNSEHTEKAFDLGGMPARNGVTAATMVQQGFTGLDDVFSGDRNFITTFARNGQPEELVRELGKRYEVMNTSIKRWSVSSPIQAALDSLSALMRMHGLSANDVERLTVRIDESGAKMVDNGASPSINIQHLLALMLIDRGAGFAAVHDRARMKAPALRKLKERIELVPAPELNDAKPPRQAIVTVITRDGRQLTERTSAVKGTPENPMTRSEVEEKSLDLLAPVLGPSRARALIETVWTIERLPDATKLRPLLRA